MYCVQRYCTVLRCAQKRVSIDNIMGSPGRPRWSGMIHTLVVQSRKQARPVTAAREASAAPSSADASDFLDVQTQWGALGGGAGAGSPAARDDLVWVVLEDSCRLLAFAADSALLLVKLDLFKKLLGAPAALHCHPENSPPLVASPSAL